MLESAVNELSDWIRSVAVGLASKANCVVAHTLDVRLTAYPIFSENNQEGLFHDLMSATRLAAKDYMHGRRVINFVGKIDPVAIMGVTASGRPRLLIVPTIVEVPIQSNGENSSGFISCVGVYSLHPVTGVRYRGRFNSSPYTER